MKNKKPKCEICNDRRFINITDTIKVPCNTCNTCNN